METNINYAVVGAFVLTIVSFIVISIIWLSSGFTHASYSSYLVYMAESVSGLTIDSAVEFNGVNVGAVKGIDLDEKNPEIVRLMLSIKSNTPITMGTIATLKSKGITGVSFVALSDKSLDLRPLVAENGQRYPIIKAGPSLFLRLDSALNKLSRNLQLVSESINSVLNKENQRLIHESLYNMQKITATIASNSRQLDAILENTSRASQQFIPLVKTFQTQTLPMSYELMSNLNNMTRNISQLSAEIKQNPSILIRGVDRSKLGPGETK
jgi:phospholipid/cholesterol/gamma-HCH transport system substrate-binding protein